MAKIDKFVVGENVTDCKDKFRAYLPPELRPVLDDLVELYESVESINNNLVTEKGIRCYKKRLDRVRKFFKDNPLIEHVNLSLLSERN
jgi:hypothetical protein